MSSPEIAALNAMQARGIDQPESLLAYAEPAAILAAIRWWDQRTGVRTGLLVKKIRDGGIDPAVEMAAPNRDRVRREQEARFAEIVERFPVGSVLEPHARLQQRRKEEQRCDGRLVAMDGQFPAVAARCDRCLTDWGYSLLALAFLPAAPLARGCQVPDPPDAVLTGNHPTRFDAAGHVLDRRMTGASP